MDQFRQEIAHNTEKSNSEQFQFIYSGHFPLPNQVGTEEQQRPMYSLKWPQHSNEKIRAEIDVGEETSHRRDQGRQMEERG